MPLGSSSIEGEMSVWVLIALFGLIKLPLAALMLWYPFRDDAAMVVQPAPGPAEDDGGSGNPPPSPRGPRPSWPIPRRPPGRRMEPMPRASSARRGDRDCNPPQRAPRRARALAGGDPVEL
jgi:hypothetical protein